MCLGGPLREQSLSKSAQEKKFSVTYYRKEYERNIARVESPQGRYMKGKRQSTVEPVWHPYPPDSYRHMGLRKINTIGLKQANKAMHLSATAYNLKKYQKFIEKLSIPIAIGSGAGRLDLATLTKSTARFLYGPSVKLQ